MGLKFYMYECVVLWGLMLWALTCYMYVPVVLWGLMLWG